jgi:rSAM/selenodomain-associated transferase 2
VIPVLDEERMIESTIRAVANLQPFEIVVVDGGSVDGTAAVVERLCAEFATLRLLVSPRGRGAQLAAGASAAAGDLYWFLHADTVPDADAIGAMQSAFSREPALAGGNFALRFTGGSFGSRFLNLTYPWYRYLGLSFGDSGIFALRSAYTAAGGFDANHPIFEDLDFLKRLRRQGGFAHLGARVTTSSRRWENRSFAPIYGRWVLLQVLYWLGVPPRRLVRAYPNVRTTSASSGA